jgi:hypothetical protein
MIPLPTRLFSHWPIPLSEEIHKEFSLQSNFVYSLAIFTAGNRNVKKSSTLTYDVCGTFVPEKEKKMRYR